MFGNADLEGFRIVEVLIWDKVCLLMMLLCFLDQNSFQKMILDELRVVVVVEGSFGKGTRCGNFGTGAFENG